MLWVALPDMQPCQVMSRGSEMSVSMKCYSSKHDRMSWCLMAYLCIAGKLSRNGKCYMSSLPCLVLPLLIALLDIGAVSAGKLQTTTMSGTKNSDFIQIRFKLLSTGKNTKDDKSKCCVIWKSVWYFAKLLSSFLNREKL